jgi:ferredoxin-NADP reductase
MTEAQPRRRIKELEVMVAEVVQETHDTVTLVLFTGNDHLEYKAGHFLTIDPHQFPALERFIAYFEDQKGRKEPPRAYSMSSSPQEKRLAITIKEEIYVRGLTKYPPLLSPMLVRRTDRGMHLVVTGFTGPYTLADDVEAKTDHIVHVCAGSGSVPNFAMLKYALEAHPKLRHTFIYSNKTWDDVIFKRQLEELAARNTDRLRLHHALTRETGDLAGAHKGRLNAEVLARLIPDPKGCLAYVCGPGISVWDRAAAKAKGEPPPPRFLESSIAALASIGVPDEGVHSESYG